MAEAVVVDSSTLLDLLISPGTAGDDIRHRLSDTEMHAPDHLPIEVTNVLRRRHNASLLSTAEAQEALDGFWQLPIQLWPLEINRDRVWQLGVNLSSYDAAYVALAERLDAPLLTGDARIARAPKVRCVVEVTG